MPLSPSTLKIYSSTLRRVYGVDPESAPEPGSLLPAPPISDETSNSTRGIIRGAVRWWYAKAGRAQEGEQLANAIPFIHEVQRLKRYPSSEQIKLFWHAVNNTPTPKQELLAIPLLLGLRAAEILGLSRAAVEEAVRTGVLTVQRKGGKEAQLPIVNAKPYFKKLLKVGRYTASLSDEGPWDVLWQVYATSERGAYWTMRRTVLAVAKKANTGVEWTPHTLRHAFASEMVRNGAPLPVVQRALGHASYQTTVSTYVHIDTKDLEKWMEVAQDAEVGPPKTQPKVPPREVVMPPELLEEEEMEAEVMPAPPKAVEPKKRQPRMEPMPAPEPEALPPPFWRPPVVPKPAVVPTPSKFRKL